MIEPMSGKESETIATRQYDAFGNMLSSTGTWNTHFGYAGNFGYQGDDSTGLKLLGHRTYDPSTSRFISRDPIRDGPNWYGYGGGEGSPLVFADQTGDAIIRIGTRSVAGLGTHTYIIIICEITGEVWTISGGPESHEGFGIIGAGGLTNYSGPFTDARGRPVSGNYERGNGVQDASGDTILNDDRFGIDWYNELNGIGDRIEAGGTGYRLVTTNSNAFVWNMMRYGGLLDEFTWMLRISGFGKDTIDNLGREKSWWPGWEVPLKLGGSRDR